MNPHEEAMFALFAKFLGMSETQLRMQLAVPDSLVRDIVADNRRPNPVTSGPSGIIPQKDYAPPVRRGTGWQDAAELGPSPSSIALMDRMMDQQDLQDRAERILDAAKSAAIEQATKGSGGK